MSNILHLHCESFSRRAPSSTSPKPIGRQQRNGTARLRETQGDFRLDGNILDEALKTADFMINSSRRRALREART